MRILVFAPHADDEVLGCGGTMARYASNGAEITVCVVTSGMPPVYDNSIAVANGWPSILYPEAMESNKVIGVKETVFLQFPCVLLEQEPRNVVNERIIKLVQEKKPDIVFIPHFGDMQKDHAIVAESVMVAMRPKYQHKVKTVFAYETLSETEWNTPHSTNAFLPNVYIDISAYLDKKIEAMKCYKSQLGDFPNPRSIEAIKALARYRGSTMGANAAEAFMLVREYS